MNKKLKPWKNDIDESWFRIPLRISIKNKVCLFKLELSYTCTELEVHYMRTPHMCKCALICQGMFHEWWGKADKIKELPLAGNQLNEICKVNPYIPQVYLNIFALILYSFI